MGTANGEGYLDHEFEDKIKWATRKEKDRDLDKRAGRVEGSPYRTCDKLAHSQDLPKLELCSHEITNVLPPQRISTIVEPPIDEYSPGILVDRERPSL